MTRLEQLDKTDRHNDLDDNPVVETEQGDTLTRLTYKTGYSGWTSSRIQLSEHDQDALEEAYELGVKAMERQMQNLRENVKNALLQAEGNGVFKAAVAAYGGKR